LFKKRLLLDTADFDEQVQAADAGVRAAEADLDATVHEFSASQLEDASLGLLYQSSFLEIQRQEDFEQIGVLQSQIATLDQDAANLDKEIAEGGANAAQLTVKKAQILQQAAKARLQMATSSRSLVLEQIEFLNILLKNDVTIPLPDGSKQTFHGQI